MCGILGGNNSRWDYKKGIESMSHRGPDGIRIDSMEDFTLAFARLAIIDLSVNGMQPMFSIDGQVGIVFNGEIYGYQKLKKELEKKGYRFRSTTDTEVILNAYIEWGEKFVTRVDGMFGMAIYDKRDGMIRLFRDRVGIKPLYYYYDGVNFGFSSELKGIVNMCNTVSLQVDYTAVYDYLNYIYIPEPKTYYKNVYKMLPGHRVIFDIKSKRIVKDSDYWKLNVNSNQASERKQSDIVEELKELIKVSVREQMIADVPVGTFLSGGVDSSIITYEGYKINPLLECFSMGFTQRDYNELQYARKLVERYKINWNVKVFDRDIFLEHYSRLKDWYDEPFADSSAFPTYIVSKIAKEKVTVVLTGDGGDEIFGGYDRHKAIWQKEKDQAPDNLLLSYVYSKLHKNGLDHYWMDELTFILRDICGIPRPSDKELRKQFGIPKDYDMFWKFRQYYFKDLPPMTRTQYLDLKTCLPGDVLTKVDRASMAVSLEARVPFLARRVVEFSFSLSEEDRLPNGVLKGVLKKAYEEEVGKAILYRKKMGFSMPYNFFKEGELPEAQLLKDLWGKDIKGD